MAAQTTTSGAYAPPAAIGAWRNRALVAGVVGAVLTGIGFATNYERAMHSYLVSWLWVVALPLGGLALLMLNHVTRGAWGIMIRRILEAATRTLPLLALLLVPVLLDLDTNFHWSVPGIAEEGHENYDALVALKVAYLNDGFFLLRTLVYFLVFGGLILALNRWSRDQDLHPGIGNSVKMQKLSTIGLLIFGIVASFAGIDWLMSLDAHWFSSIYGIYFIGGAALMMMALAVAVLTLLSRHGGMADAVLPAHFHDYGKLLLAFIMLWAYFSVSQLIIIYSGNLPEEAPWYLYRSDGMWKPLIFVIVFGQFVLPFLALLNTSLKKDRNRLALVALLIVAMRWVDLYWQAGPSMHIEQFHWLDLATALGLMGLWLAVFFWQLARRPLLPVNEPFLKEALAHG